MILSRFFRSDTIIGMEITSSQIILLEADTSEQPIRVLNFVLIDLFSLHEDNIAQQIKGILEKGWFKGKNANIAISHPSVIHRLITLPSMPREEMGMIIGREVKSYPDEVVFDWQIIREVEEKGIKKREVLIAIAPSSEVNHQRSLVQSSGLRCGVLTTIPLALLSSLKFIRDGEKGAVAFLHLGMERGHLLFAREGKWCFSREFAHEGKGFSEEQVLSEVKRSIHYFKQHFRGEELERIITGGKVKEELDTIRGNLEENLEVKTEIFDPTHGLDLSLVKGRSKEWEKVLPNLAIVLGLVGQYPRDAVINLIPPKIKRREKEFKKRAVAGSLAAVILLGFAITYGGLSQSLKSRNDILRQKEAALKKIQPFLDKARISEEKRNRYDKSLSFLDLKKKRAPWVKALRILSLIVPDKMVFQSLKAERIEDGWQLNIKVEVVAADSYTVQKNFNQFYSQFRYSPIFSNIELMPLNIIRFKESGKEEKRKGDFEIKCRLKNEIREK